MILRIISRVHTRLGGCSCNTCERSTTSGVKDMVLGLTPTIRYRPASSIEFNNRQPLSESVKPPETVVSRCPRIVRNRNAWGRSESRIDMVNPNISPAGSRSLHVVLPCFFPVVYRYSFNRGKPLCDIRCEARTHTCIQACPWC